jgi:cytochrome b subunit of formate dehydrogenase
LSETKREINKIIQEQEKRELEFFEEIENENKYKEKRQKIQKTYFSFTVLFIVLSGITGIISRFFNESFIKLIIDIINIIGFVGCVVSVLTMLIKLRILEKNKNKDW